MRRCPHRGFCLASRWTSSRISSGMGVLWRSGESPCSSPGAGARRAGCRRHYLVQRKALGQQPRQGGDHGPASPVRLRAGDLTAQDRNLVPQHQDLT